MPIADVRIVTSGGDALPQGLAVRLADAIGAALETPPGRTWVFVTALAREAYAENAMAPDETPLPVLVSLVVADWPSRELMTRRSAALAQAIGSACGRAPESVHILWEPAARGRVAFGGQLLE